MKTEQIEKAAQEYAAPTRTYMLGEETQQIKDAFKSGARYALSNQWVSVDEALPEDNRMVMVHISDINIIPDLSYCMAYYDNGAWQFPDDYYYDCKVTHWMPIPKFNK